MTRWTLAAIVFSASCLPPPSPAQQIRDGETAAACVFRDWGQPIDVIAHDCTQGVVDVAIDLIADGAALLGAHGVSNPYATDARVQTSMRARFSRDGGTPAPVTGTGTAGEPPAPAPTGHLSPR